MLKFCFASIILVKGRIRIRTSEQWIQILEAQKYVDPGDPDPQHWFDVISWHLDVSE